MNRFHRGIGVALGVLVSIGLAGPASTETEETSSAANLGKAPYERYCAACHGLDGRGSGDFANLLKDPPTDLTAIAERRGGSFPSIEIGEIIDGRRTMRAHGTAEMPVWGARLGELSPAGQGSDVTVRGEIYLIVQYLRSLQPGAQPEAESPELEAEKVAAVGEAEFLRNCASCHGTSGTGDGYVGALLAKAPPNLRTIARRNGGSFPTLKIAKIIDGREGIIAHGPGGMPVWGRHGHARGGVSRGSAVRGEIMLYVAFLRTIQEP